MGLLMGFVITEEAHFESWILRKLQEILLSVYTGKLKIRSSEAGIVDPLFLDNRASSHYFERLRRAGCQRIK